MAYSKSKVNRAGAVLAERLRAAAKGRRPRAEQRAELMEAFEIIAVRSFDTDYDAAQEAYAQAEQESDAKADGLDIVLLGADSLETIKQTHSSYFRGKARQFEGLLPS